MTTFPGRRALPSAACAAALAALAACCAFAEEGLEKAERKVFSGKLDVSVRSGYLTSSGSLYDTRPVTTQCLTEKADLGDFGYVEGYAWFISSLHNRQKDRHRVLFNEFEGAVFYGYPWRICRNVVLDTKAGPLWNPPIGYWDAHRNCWGPYVVQSLENPYVTPYWAGLWIMQPQQRGRVKIGLLKKFPLCDAVAVTPSIDTVWMDRRRFFSRYGGNPEKDGIFGGAFATVVASVKGEWRFAPDWKAYATLMQYDIINNQARRAVRRNDAYWSKCDWPVLRVGVEYSF